MITIRVIDVEQFDEGFPPDTLEGVIEWLQEHYQSIPREYRKTASCEISSIEGYEGSHYATIGIYYERPWTDEEKKSSLEQEARNQEKIRTNELELLANLKRKYPNS